VALFGSEHAGFGDVNNWDGRLFGSSTVIVLYGAQTLLNHWGRLNVTLNFFDQGQTSFSSLDSPFV